MARCDRGAPVQVFTVSPPGACLSWWPCAAQTQQVDVLRVAEAELRHLKPDRVGFALALAAPSAVSLRRPPPAPVGRPGVGANGAAASSSWEAVEQAQPCTSSLHDAPQQAVYQRVGGLLLRTDKGRAAKAVSEQLSAAVAELDQLQGSASGSGGGSGNQ